MSRHGLECIIVTVSQYMSVACVSCVPTFMSGIGCGANLA